MSLMYFIILAILQSFTPKILQISRHWRSLRPPYLVCQWRNKSPTQGRTQDSPGGQYKAYMPKNVPNIQRIINNDILKIVNIVLVIGGGTRGGATAPPPPEKTIFTIFRMSLLIILWIFGTFFGI